MISLILSITASLFGIALVSGFNVVNEKITTILVGSITGLALTTALVYLVTPFVRLNEFSTLGFSVILIISLILLITKQRAWKRGQGLPIDRTALSIFIILIGLFSLIAPKLLINTDTGLSTAVINAYGDIGFHVATITTLRDNQTLLPHNPILAGKTLTYPFMSNFFSAILVANGASLVQSVVGPALFLIPLTLTLLYILAYQLTKRRDVAIIALLLFLFGGSTVGWLRITADWEASQQPFSEFITHLPRNYTGHSDDKDGLNMINPIISLLLPQRAFLFGMPLAFAILIILLNQTQTKATYMTAGLIAGLLPIFHAHSVIALVPAIIALFLIRPSKQWVWFVAAALVIGLPSLLYYLTSPASASVTPHLQLGWMAHRTNLILYWLKNTGLIVPLALFGLMKTRQPAAKGIAIAGLFLLIISNIWLFAAWEWDNTKLLVYAILFCLPLASQSLTTLLQHRHPALKGTAVALIVFHLASGTIDIFQLTLPKTQQWPEWDQDAITISEAIRKNSLPGQGVASAATHNSAVALSGRPMYLGYPGHVWTHGEDFSDRQNELKRFYSGQQMSLTQTPTNLILVGPQERYEYQTLIIQPTWTKVAQAGSYILYKKPSSL